MAVQTPAGTCAAAGCDSAYGISWPARSRARTTERIEAIKRTFTGSLHVARRTAARAIITSVLNGWLRWYGRALQQPGNRGDLPFSPVQSGRPLLTARSEERRVGKECRSR